MEDNFEAQIKEEMHMMLNEELARAILFDDGRYRIPEPYHSKHCLNGHVTSDNDDSKGESYMMDICNSCIYFNNDRDKHPCNSCGEGPECKWIAAQGNKLCHTCNHKLKWLDEYPCSECVCSRSNINKGNYWERWKAESYGR